MIDEIKRIESDATERIATTRTLDDVRALDIELLGKRSALNGLSLIHI